MLQILNIFKFLGQARKIVAATTFIIGSCFFNPEDKRSPNARRDGNSEMKWQANHSHKHEHTFFALEIIRMRQDNLGNAQDCDWGETLCCSTSCAANASPNITTSRESQGHVLSFRWILQEVGFCELSCACLALLLLRGCENKLRKCSPRLSYIQA